MILNKKKTLRNKKKTLNNKKKTLNNKKKAVRNKKKTLNNKKKTIRNKKKTLRNKKTACGPSKNVLINFYDDPKKIKEQIKNKELVKSIEQLGSLLRNYKSKIIAKENQESLKNLSSYLYWRLYASENFKIFNTIYTKEKMSPYTKILLEDINNLIKLPNHTNNEKKITKLNKKGHLIKDLLYHLYDKVEQQKAITEPGVIKYRNPNLGETITFREIIESINTGTSNEIDLPSLEHLISINLDQPYIKFTAGDDKSEDMYIIAEDIDEKEAIVERQIQAHDYDDYTMFSKSDIIEKLNDLERRKEEGKSKLP